MKWLSKYSPEECAARRELARLEALARQAPTAPQLAHLQALGDTAPPPANAAEASQRIAHLRRGEVA